MPSEADHRAEALANRRLAEYLLANHSTDPNALRWAVTATFYSALHAVTVHLVQHGISVGNHDDRATALASGEHALPNHVFAAYQLLRRRSSGARYLIQRFTADQVRALLDNELHEVFRFVGL